MGGGGGGIEAWELIPGRLVVVWLGRDARLHSCLLLTSSSGFLRFRGSTGLTVEQSDKFKFKVQQKIGS